MEKSTNKYDDLVEYEHRIGVKDLLFVIGLSVIPPICIFVVILFTVFVYIQLYMAHAWVTLITSILTILISFIQWNIFLGMLLKILIQIIPELIKMINNFIREGGLVFRVDELGITYFDDDNNKIVRSWNEVEDVGVYRQGKKVEWKYQLKFIDGQTCNFSGVGDVTTEELKQKIENFWYHYLDTDEYVHCEE